MQHARKALIPARTLAAALAVACALALLLAPGTLRSADAQPAQQPGAEAAASGTAPGTVSSSAPAFPLPGDAYDADEPIYVIGHTSPDSDTVCSAIALACFLSQMGYPAVPATAGNPNAETGYALEKFGTAAPMVLEAADDRQFFLVDHSSFAQSVAGMEDATVLGIVDHHALGGATTPSPAVYLCMPVGCTATVVYGLFATYGVAIPQDVAGLMLTAILSDTVGLKSSTTTDCDRSAVEALVPLAAVDNPDAYAQELLDAGNVYDGMTAEEILLSDYKEYNAGGTHFSVAQVQSTRPDQLEQIGAQLDAYMETGFAGLDVDMCFVMLSDTAALQTTLACYGDQAIATAQEAFATDEEPIVLQTVSRKKGVIPALTAALE